MKVTKSMALVLAVLMVLVCFGGCGSDKPKATDLGTTSATIGETTVTTDRGTTALSADGSESTPTESVTVPQSSSSAAEPTGSATTYPGQPTSTGKPSGGGNTTATVTTTVTNTTAKTTVTTQSRPQSPPKPVTLKALTPGEYYGYRYLASQGKTAVAVYDCVASGVADMQAEISLKDAGISIKTADLQAIMRCYHADYPQHFWYNGAYSYVVDGSDTVLSVKPTYTMSVSQKKTAQEKVDAVVRELLKTASYGQTEYERERILHDALAERVSYVDGANAHNLYGALVEGKAVCEGYSRAFQYLLYQAGTQCLIAEGTSIRPGSNTGVAHAWNVVKINGRYYHTDVTWDDQSNAAVPVMHAFYNLNDALIKEGHTIGTELPYPLPVCNSTADSYFVKEGTEVTAFTVDKVAELFVKGNGTATVYVSKNTVNEFITWFQTNISAISSKAQLSGKTFSLQYCGREVIIVAK